MAVADALSALMLAEIIGREPAKTFWGGVNVDYTDLQSRGAQISAALSAGNELHIKDSNGTDLKVKVQGRAYGVSDGIISAEDAKTFASSLTAPFCGVNSGFEAVSWLPDPTER